MGVRRVACPRTPAFRRARGSRLQPRQRARRCARAAPRRGVGGDGGPRDALAPRQGRLAAQPARGPAPGEGRLVVTVAHATVDIAALKARHPLGDVVEASGVRLRGRGRVRQGVCPFHGGGRGQLHGLRRLGALVLLRLRRGRRRAGLPPAQRGPEPAGGDPAARRLADCPRPPHPVPPPQQRHGPPAGPGAADGSGAPVRLGVAAQP